MKSIKALSPSSSPLPVRRLVQNEVVVDVVTFSPVASKGVKVMAMINKDGFFARPSLALSKSHS